MARVELEKLLRRVDGGLNVIKAEANDDIRFVGKTVGAFSVSLVIKV